MRYHAEYIYIYIYIYAGIDRQPAPRPVRHCPYLSTKSIRENRAWRRFREELVIDARRASRRGPIAVRDVGKLPYMGSGVRTICHAHTRRDCAQNRRDMSRTVSRLADKAGPGAYRGAWRPRRKIFATLSQTVHSRLITKDICDKTYAKNVEM